jgi:addiction module HigA family antidote
MAMSIKAPPNGMRPTHPGAILRDELAELDMSAAELARALDVPANRIAEIVAERRAVSVDTAMRLARYFGTSAQLWLNLQQSYELRTAQLRNGKRIERSIRPRGRITGSGPQERRRVHRASVQRPEQRQSPSTFARGDWV